MPLRWTGAGFLHGIPARDLSEDEVKQFGKKYLLTTGLYEEVKDVAPETQAEEVDNGRSKRTPATPVR